MAKKNKGSFRIRFAELLLVIFIAVSSLLLGFSSGGFVLDFKRIGFSIVSTVDKGVHFVVDGVKNTINSVGELRRLKKDYNELVVKLEDYEKIQRANADIKKENDRLREQLDFSLSMEEKNIPAQIISRNFDTAYSYLTIDKGSVNGIKKNMPVVAIQDGNRGLVGKVIQVGTFTSQIIPIYNLDFTVSARVQNTRDLGLVNGLGSEDQPLVLHHIKKRVLDDNNLQYGDIIVTSGENANYMRDIPIGSITQISVIEYNSSLDIELNPIIDFSRLETVIVVNQKELNDRKETSVDLGE